jgi:hypothetical protein
VDRTPALIVALGLLVAAVAAAKPSKPAKTPKPAPTLHVRAVDLPHRLVLVELAGTGKAPAANLFTLTDDRERHYIPQTAHCDPPQPGGVQSCELEIPDGYERHPLTTLELHLKGLHGRTVAAPVEEVAAAWAQAELAHNPGLLPASIAPRPADGGVDAAPAP